LDTLAEPNGDTKNENTKSFSFDIPLTQLKEDTPLTKELQDAFFSSKFKAVFTRATNLIRKEIGVQGVILHGISVG
jgi:hypothetical protein